MGLWSKESIEWETKLHEAVEFQMKDLGDWRILLYEIEMDNNGNVPLRTGMITVLRHIIRNFVRVKPIRLLLFVPFPPAPWRHASHRCKRVENWWTPFLLSFVFAPLPQ